MRLKSLSFKTRNILSFQFFIDFSNYNAKRDVFRLAKENSPAIIFIDEIDAIATKRFDAQTGADREVQRILLELLNQMDGFDQTVNVKVKNSDFKFLAVLKIF